MKYGTQNISGLKPQEIEAGDLTKEKNNNIGTAVVMLEVYDAVDLTTQVYLTRIPKQELGETD